MVDPINFTNYNRTDNELQEVLIFGLLVAGKNALTTSRLLDALLRDFSHIGDSPFEIVRRFELDRLPKLSTVLKDYGFGCYNMKAKGLYELVRSGVNLRTCTADDLEKIRGIGPKTANLFLMHTRKAYRGCCIDTHILKFLKEKGYDVPKSTPTGRKYKQIEKIFLTICDAMSMSPADLDLKVWRYYSGHSSDCSFLNYQLPKAVVSFPDSNNIENRHNCRMIG